jgi:hypothetical protein
MKVAILFYGRLRGFREHYEQFKTLFGDDVEIDFFLSHSKELNDDQNLEEFIQLYKPISVQNDSIDFDFEYLLFPHPLCNPSHDRVINMFSHFTNKYRVFKLLDTYIKSSSTVYDWIVSCRIDLKILDKIDLRSFTDTTQIYIPIQDNNNIIIEDVVIDGRDITWHRTGEELIHLKDRPILNYFKGIKDQLAIGSYSTISIYSNLILNYKKYLYKGCINHPEVLFLENLIQNSIHIKRFPLKYMIV